MALWIGFALFSAVMAFVWGFFLIARLHVFKFKQYSTHVDPATRALAIFLLVLTVAGYVAVFTLSGEDTKKTTVSEAATVEEY